MQDDAVPAQAHHKVREVAQAAAHGPCQTAAPQTPAHCRLNGRATRAVPATHTGSWTMQRQQAHAAGKSLASVITSRARPVCGESGASLVLLVLCKREQVLQAGPGPLHGSRTQLLTPGAAGQPGFLLLKQGGGYCTRGGLL